MGTRSKIDCDEILRVNIDLPTFQLNITSGNPVQALTELRKVIEALNVDEEMMYEEFIAEELKTVFSDSFLQNTRAMEVVKKLLKQEDDYRVAAEEVTTSAMLDLRDGNKTIKVEQRAVKNAVSKITNGFDIRCVKNGIVHISGELDNDGKLIIADHIHKFMPTAQLRAFHTKGETGKVVVECIFFGDFPDED